MAGAAATTAPTAIATTTATTGSGVAGAGGASKEKQVRRAPRRWSQREEAHMHAAVLAVFGDDESAAACVASSQWERVRTFCVTTQPSVAQKWSATEIRDKFKRLFAKQTTSTPASSTAAAMDAEAGQKQQQQQKQEEA